jgi:multiple sugar transport system ATP-binding protein
MSQVTLERVSKVYDQATVVRSIDLTVHDKEFVVLVGPSGCGKTTMLRMIAGLEQISAGVIRIGGRVVNHLAAKDRDIAMVFQNYGLYPHMTVYDNMAFGLKMRKTAKDDLHRRVTEAAEFLGIGELLQRKPRMLSGGQRQRVALGRAIVRQPQVFLFDEPLSNLDAQLRVDMRSELKKLHRRLQATIVYVTHDQIEAMTMGDRIVIMKDGVIQQVGAPMDVYANPKNRFVAGFIGSPSMNFIACTLERRDGALAFAAPGMSVAVPAAKAAVLAPFEGKAVTLGIRPEELHEATAADPAGVTFDAVAEVVEPLGHESYVGIRVGAASLLARMSPETRVQVGDAMRIAVKAGKLLAFDPQTDLAIC